MAQATASPISSFFSNESHSQSQTFLKDVVAYCQIRTGNDDRSRALHKPLLKLGAKVTERLGPGVTHVIYKDGTKSTRDRALKHGAHLNKNYYFPFQSSEAERGE